MLQKTDDMKRKQILVIMGIIIIIPLYYFNSESYLLKIAKEKQRIKINEYDKIEKSYLKEGSYIYYMNVKDVEHKKDKFGKTYSKLTHKRHKEIQFSFSSRELELIIDYPYQWVQLEKDLNVKKYNHIREILEFNDKWEYCIPNNAWIFHVSSWKLIDYSTGNLIYDVFEDYSKDKEEWQKISISLIMGAEEKSPYFNSYWVFQTVGPFLYAQEQIDSYNLSFVPEYASNFRYNDYEDVYDLNKFKPRPSWNDLFENDKQKH